MVPSKKKKTKNCLNVILQKHWIAGRNTFLPTLCAESLITTWSLCLCLSNQARFLFVADGSRRSQPAGRRLNLAGRRSRQDQNSHTHTHTEPEEGALTQLVRLILLLLLWWLFLFLLLVLCVCSAVLLLCQAWAKLWGSGWPQNTYLLFLQLQTFLPHTLFCL